jgi:SAM-dependent methyltransferase
MTDTSHRSRDGDYVLGTHASEVERLRQQHETWRASALEAWAGAGLSPGMRALDVGAGPGWATRDLAALVGPGGHVTAVERAARFIDVLRRLPRDRNAAPVEVVEADLMTATPRPGHDFAWCRWVASFVPSVDSLAQWLKASLVPGGVAVFHEYHAYGTWSFLPPRPELASFVEEVMTSWRHAGGEPDIAPELVRALRVAGFRVSDLIPRVHAARPGDSRWAWPTQFVEHNLAQLESLGRVTPAWSADVRRALAGAEADPSSWLITPMVLEIRALRLED